MNIALAGLMIKPPTCLSRHRRLFHLNAKAEVDESKGLHIAAEKASSFYMQASKLAINFNYGVRESNYNQIASHKNLCLKLMRHKPATRYHRPL